MSIQKFSERFGLETITESSRNYTSVSQRQSLVKKLKNEIDLLSKRQTLEYDKKESIKRFWRQSTNDKSVGKVCLKNKNKIYNLVVSQINTNQHILSVNTQ